MKDASERRGGGLPHLRLSMSEDATRCWRLRLFHERRTSRTTSRS